MKKLYVDENSCIGCGACVALDDEHFGFNDQGLSTVISTENIDEESIQNIVDSCPTNAIKYNPNGENCNCNEECNCDDDCQCDENCQCNENCHCTK